MAHPELPPGITRRPYAHADMPRLQAALAAWVAAAGPCGYCHVGELPHRIYENFRGQPPAPEVVTLWERGGLLVALAICFRFEAAFDLFVAPEYRGSALERAALQHAHAATLRRVRRARPADSTVITDVYGCDDTRKALLAELGFSEYRQWDNVVERDLAEPIPEPLLPPGFALRAAAPDDYGQLAAARASAFGAPWAPELYRDEVMGRPGYALEDELLVVAPDGRVAAFTVARRDERNRTALFEPVGTHADFRRLGLARALLLSALRDLRRGGMRSAQLSYDATNLPAHALYAGLGFRLRDITLGYTCP